MLCLVLDVTGAVRRPRQKRQPVSRRAQHDSDGAAVHNDAYDDVDNQPMVGIPCCKTFDTLDRVHACTELTQTIPA